MAATRLSERAGTSTRDAILAHAVQAASREGLEALTIGRLAKRLSLSKSGLFAHFGSKQELQLAVVGRASAVFQDRVSRIGRHFAPGLERLLALLDAWLAYVTSADFEGGCFFASASAEFDGKPGPVRDELARLARSWMAALHAEATKAVRRKQLRADTDLDQLVFELHAVVQEANWALQLLGDRDAGGRARAAILARITGCATPEVRGVVPAMSETVAREVSRLRGEGPRASAADVQR